MNGKATHTLNRKVPFSEFYPVLKQKVIIAFAVLYLVTVANSLVSYFVGFGMNASHSLVGNLFIENRMDVSPRRGEIFSFKYYGEIYPHGSKFTKRIVGLPGDVVTVRGRTFYINDVPVGEAKEFGLLGQPLKMNEFRGVIPRGKFWFATEHVDSFDSRYADAGLGDEQDIIGRAYTLF